MAETPSLLNSSEFINGTGNESFLLNLTTTVTPIIAETDHKVVRNIIYNHLGPIVCVFGMLTNVINLVVLIQNELPESPYTQLTGLACVDFGALFLSFIYMVGSKDSFSYVWKVFDAYIFVGFVNTCTTGSIWITVQLTIERYLFVAHPLWAKDTCDRASAKFKIMVTVLASAIFNIPRFCVFEPLEYKPGQWALSSTEFRKSDAFFWINWMYSVCVHFIPLLILSCANSFLVYAVHQAGQQRQRLDIRNNREAAWQREQRRLTITLISIVFLFIVCIIPSAFSDRPIAFALFGGNLSEEQFVVSNFYYNLQYIANFLVWLELSLNFVLYCAFNEKFRRVMSMTAMRLINKFRAPLCRRKPTGTKVLFKSGHSSTRNSVLNTNSLMMNSKESQPLHVKMEKVEHRPDKDNQYTTMMDQEKQ